MLAPGFSQVVVVVNAIQAWAQIAYTIPPCIKHWTEITHRKQRPSCRS
jgi:hypothetical protein